MKELEIYTTLRNQKLTPNEYDKLHVIARLFKRGKISKYELLDICDETLLTGVIEIVLELEVQCKVPTNEAIKEVLNKIKYIRAKAEKALMDDLDRFDKQSESLDEEEQQNEPKDITGPDEDFDV